ncbi:MAG TPA: SDR family oxidoreductase [Candidatus Thermoplasmatota archaeon]|nr:SDR family oxidoreductase [Candidatus Thermoplasmatota archaeon]
MTPARSSLRGQTALVTGATSGIGEATAHALAEAGADLILVARRAPELARVAGQLQERHGVKVGTLTLDVRDRAAIEQAIEARPDLLSRVDILVNNAGLARGTDPLQKGDPADWEEVIETNVLGLLAMTRAIVPHMVARGRGHIVNLGSTAGHWVYPGGAVYCASKHAVRAITEGLRMDLHGSGVRVSSVDPGLVETNFSVVRFKGDKERAKKVYEGLQPLTPEDIADAILWCVTRPAHVNIQDIVMMPVDQASVTMVHRRPTP